MRYYLPGLGPFNISSYAPRPATGASGRISEILRSISANAAWFCLTIAAYVSMQAAIKRACPGWFAMAIAWASHSDRWRCMSANISWRVPSSIRIFSSGVIEFPHPTSVSAARNSGLIFIF